MNENKPLEVELGLCHCGCGQPTKLASKTSTKDGRVKGQPQRYLHGHGNRWQPRRWILRECANCHRWSSRTRQRKFCSQRCAEQGQRRPRSKQGGLYFNRGEKRWHILCRDGTKLRYARGVMAAQVGRLLARDEVVHHINGDSTDDRPENLRILRQSEHIALHREQLSEGRWGR